MSSGELKPIIFYDIASITPGRPWSPNTLKTRYCLGYKRLPFTTVWVELPGIAKLLLSKGVAQPPYTLPAIEDPNTGAFIVDSFAIATYLDETYLQTPMVLSPAARTALEGIEDLFSFGSAQTAKTGTGPSAGADAARVREFGPRLVFLVLASERLNPVSKVYYQQTRAARIGELWTSLSDACAANPEAREECVQQGIKAIVAVWRKVTAAAYGEDGEGSGFGPEEQKGSSGIGKRFALGEEPCFLDFAVAGRVKFALDALTPSEAAMLTSLGGERLTRLVEDLEKYL